MKLKDLSEDMDLQERSSGVVMKSIKCCGVVVLSLLIGCAHQKDEFSKRSPDSIYQKGMQLLKGKEFTDAASEFKDIETLFPYSEKAVEGQVLAAYSYYQAKSYKDALRELDIFERYHPAHSYIPYVMYLRAMCLYMQVSSIGRDSKMAIESKIAFTKLANRFPQSKYYDDCVKKVKLLDNLLAAHEMSVARFYQKNKSALSAIGRYNYVVASYPMSSYAAEAHFRIMECCHAIGLLDEAKIAYEALKSKFDGSVWLKKAEVLALKSR